MIKSTKEVLSCRIPQELKHKLETDAQLEGTTTSKYVEQLILNRQDSEHITEDKEEEYLQRIEELERRLAETEQTRVHYENRLGESEQEILNLTEERDDCDAILTETIDKIGKLEEQILAHRAISAEKDVIISEFEAKETLNFLSAEHSDFSEYISQLKKHYPDANKEQIILGSLYAAAQNEQPIVFVVSRIKNYFKTL